MNTTLPTTEFQPFSKMARLAREAVITEKIDGTNAQILIEVASEAQKAGHLVGPYLAVAGDYVLCAGSRTRWVTPGKTSDNYGFAQWVLGNAQELVKLGPGRHFGEWYGRGINSGYGLDHRRFALFNTSRWSPVDGEGILPGVRDISIDCEPGEIVLGPLCCYVVPVIWRGVFDTRDIDNAVEMLRSLGSFAVPGFRNPEGVVCYHIASGQFFKKTLVDDASPKSLPGVTDPRVLSSGVEAAQAVFNQKIGGVC